MRKKYYTAQEAAEVLGLKYHTFVARVHRGVYAYETWGRTMIFRKRYIDSIAVPSFIINEERKNHAVDS